MTNLTPSELVYLACGLGGLVIFASVVAGLVVAAAVAGQLLG
jgi:hypothetical protein